MLSGPAPEFGTPAVLFQTAIHSPALAIDQEAVTPDGQRFLVLSPAVEAAASRACDLWAYRGLKILRC